MSIEHYEREAARAATLLALRRVLAKLEGLPEGVAITITSEGTTYFEEGIHVAVRIADSEVRPPHVPAAAWRVCCETREIGTNKLIDWLMMNGDKISVRIGETYTPIQHWEGAR